MITKLKLWRATLQNNEYVKKILSLITNLFFFLTITFFLGFDAIYPLNVIGRLFFVGFVGFACLYFLVFMNKPREIKLLAFGVISLILLILLSTVVNKISHSPFTPVFNLALCLFVFWWGSENKHDTNIFYLLFLIATWIFLLALLVIDYKTIISFNFSSRYFATFFGNSNDVARKIMFSLILNIGFFFKAKPRAIKALSIIISLIFTYLLILTGSFSNTILVTLIWIIVIYLLFPQKYRWLYFLLLFLGLCGIIVLLNLPTFEYFKHRIENLINTFINGGSGGSTYNRFLGAYYGLQLFLERPLFGFGANGVFNNYAIMSHNNMVELLADFGIFAFVLFELLLIVPFINIRKLKKCNFPFVLLIIFYLFFNQFFLVEFNEKMDMMILGFIYVIFENDIHELGMSLALPKPRIKLKKEVIKI